LFGLGLVFQASVAQADVTSATVGSYHTYHNSLAGVVIASPACGTLIVDSEAGRSVLDVIDATLGVEPESAAFWVYDGARTWEIRRMPIFGGYDKYIFVGSDCIIYTNSVTAKVLLDLYEVYKTRHFDAYEYSLPRTEMIE
jgi:hypothetical protein